MITLLSVHIISVTTIFAQNKCSCAKFDSEISNKLLGVDSTTLFNTITELKISGNAVCMFNSLSLEYSYYKDLREYNKALKVLNKQEIVLEKFKCKSEFYYEFIRRKTLYYHITGDYENLSAFAFKCLEEAERLNETQKKIESLMELAFLFNRLNEDEKNWEYIKRAEKLILNSKHDNFSIPNFRWLAYQFETRYTFTGKISLIDSVIIFAKKSLNKAIELEVIDEIAKNYRALEAASYHQGNLPQALVYIDSAIFYAKKVTEIYNLSPLFLSKAWDHLDLGQFDKAIFWADSALYYDEINSAGTAGYMMANLDLASLYEEAGKIDKAYACYKTYSKLKDSIFSIQRTTIVNELEQKYFKADNEKKIFELEKTKQFYTFLIVSGLLTILIIILFFRQLSLKNKQKNIEIEQRLNRARMEPHFFFNALSSIQTLALKEQSPKTVLLLSKFSKIMRQSLESSYQEMVTIEEDCDFLREYIELQQARYPGIFNYNITIADEIDVSDTIIPGMILQPFIENSIEHGFKNITYVGMIEIVFNIKNDGLKIMVKDNGCIGKEKENSTHHVSRAIQIITDRLYLLKKQTKKEAYFEVVSMTDEKGYHINLTLPLIYK